MNTNDSTRFIEVNVLAGSASPTMLPHRAIVGVAHIVKVAENPAPDSGARITLSISPSHLDEPWFVWQEDLSGPTQQELSVAEDFFCLRWLLTFANTQQILSFKDYEKTFSPALQRPIKAPKQIKV